MKISKLIEIVLQLNFKTLYINFKFLPFRKAIRLPIVVSRNVVIRKSKGKISLESKSIGRGMVSIGYGDVKHIDRKYPRTIIEINGELVFKGCAHIGHGSCLRVENGRMVLGNNFRITARSTIIANKYVEFGDDCLLSWDTIVMDTDYHTILDINDSIINEPADIIIGNSVWIGCRVTILKGTGLGNGSIVGANTTLSKIYKEENVILAGTPARIVKSNVHWKV